MSFSISSREDWKSASSVTVETSAEVDSLCDSADVYVLLVQAVKNASILCVCVCVCVRERERER